MKQQTTHSRNRVRGVHSVTAVVLTALLTLVVVPVSAQYESLPTAPNGEQESFAYDDLGLRVNVWLDKGQDDVYRKGEDLAAGFQTNGDAYAVVYRVDTEGLVTILWPRSPLDDGFVFGGHEYNLPVTGSRRLRVSTSEGEGFVVSVVSQYPFDLRRLELDFHHEHRADSYDFRVAGDPYLAMNEVNFAITGLEDSGDYVVTNHAAYYVHREVEHPRYLCNQCHFEDDAAYDPYRDECSLQITVDHSWDNGWWDSYGYYPVYMNPVYVYVDPWSHQPWVNFWYTPYWRVPSVVVCDWYSPVYVWGDHPRYRGDCGLRWRDSGGRSQPPLTVVLNNGSRTKTREYGQVTAMVDPRGATRSKGQRTSGKDAGTVYKGKKAIRRPNERFERDDLRDGNHGLRISRGGGGSRQTDPARSPVRHTAGNKTTSPTRSPVGRVTAGPSRIPGNTKGTRSVGKVPRSRTASPGAGSGGTTRTVDPRQKGTRIWNSSKQGGTRKQRPGTVRPAENTRGRSTTRDGAVRPGTSTRGGASKNTRPARTQSGTVRKSTNSGGSSKATRGGTTVRKSGTSTKSSATSKSGKTRSSSGGTSVRSSGSSNKSSSTGATRSSGGGAQSRGGGTSKKRR